MEGVTQYLLLVGLVLALLAGLAEVFMNSPHWLALLAVVQVIIGLLLGFYNLQPKETSTFFLASLAFLASYQLFLSAVSSLTALAPLWSFLGVFLQYMAFLVAPAMVVVGLRSLFEVLKD